MPESTPDSAPASQRRRVTPLIWVFLLLAAVLTGSNLLSFFQLERDAYTVHLDTYLAGTERAALIIGEQMLQVESAADALAAEISDGSLLEPDFKQALASMLGLEDIFYGGAIAFAPYAVDPTRRLYAPYFSKQEDELVFARIEDAYDYTADEQEWYVEAMASGSRWSQPYFDEDLGDILMTTYSSVIYRVGPDGGREPIGVVTIDIAVDAIGEQVKSFDLGGAGHAEILSDKGVYLYSPDKSLVLDRQSLTSHSNWQRDTNFGRLQELLSNGEAGMVEVYDSAAEAHQWVTLAPVPGSGWRILGIFAQQEVDPKTADLRHRLMFIILGVVLALCVTLLVWQVVAPRDAVLSWPTAVLVSAVLLAGVAQIWWVAMTYASTHDRERYPIYSEESVAGEVTAFTQRARERLTELPEFVPTGLYIESMRFRTSSDIEVVGSIWQKFGVDAPAPAAPGFVLPGASRLRLSEPFILEEAGERLVRHQFDGEWRFRHDYSRYPLVKDVFSLAVLPADMADNVMLLPDVESYAYLAPATLPGVGPDVFLLGWHMKESYFELLPWRHNTTFGRADTLRTDRLPELHYSVEVEKAFIHSVISSLTPLIIALLISFITLLISTSDKEKLEFLRTGVGFDIGISTSIFFVVVLSHIGLRERIVSEQVFYLEYFYMLMYANLIWKCSHSIMGGLQSPLLGRLTHGVSAKKAFFPVNCAIIFAFTWLAFYA